MSDQIKTIRRFFRRLHRSILNSIPNDGPTEVDLSKLQRPIQNDPNSDFSMDWRSPEQPSDLPGHTKT
jgi:hypothetical protein